jgi:GLPGLI family protein
MLKIFLNVLLLFITTSLFGQKTPYFEAKYDIYYNTDFPQIRKGQLQIDVEKNLTIFHISKNNNSSTESNSAMTSTHYGLTYNIKYDDIESFIEINFNKEYIFSKETHRNNIYYVRDTIYDFNWNLNYSEEKKIGTLLCKKATTYFRGRNYTAWYAIEIPIGYGPYKFHGLPGLIAKISDDTGTFIWTLASYKVNAEKPQFEKNDELKPLMSAKEYYEEVRYQSVTEKQTMLQSKLPKGIKLISVSSDANVRKGIEIKFEWEEEIKED